MKVLRIWMMAVLTVFIGTTLTSCFESDDTVMPYWSYATISNSYGPSITTDEGTRLIATNPQALEFKFDNDPTFTPERAVIGYHLVEGEEIVEGKTTYNVTLAVDYGLINAYAYFTMQNGRYVDIEPLTTQTPVYLLDIPHFGQNYLDLYLKTKTIDDEFSMNEFRLCITGVDNQTINLKLMNAREIENNTPNTVTTNIMMSYQVPPKDMIISRYPGLNTFGANSDSVYVKFANTIDNEHGNEIPKFPIKLR